MKHLTTIVIVILSVVVVAGVYQWAQPTSLTAPLSGVRVGDQYLATTTPQVDAGTSLCGTSRKTGVLGTVNVLGPSTSDLLLLDATTTERTNSGRAATSTLILAWYPDGFATSTNTYDIQFNTGLLVDYSTGVATASISYRCEG